MSERKIHFPEDEVWTYFIGKQHIRIRDLTHKKTFIVDFSTLTGGDWESIEHDQHKRNFHILPSEIKEYIEKNLRSVVLTK